MLHFKKLMYGTAMFVLVSSLSTGLTYAESSKVAVTNASVLNLRESPDIESRILDQLDKGTQAPIVKDSNGWYKITYEDKTGWVSGQYVTIKESKSSKASASTLTNTQAGSQSQSWTGAITVNGVNLRKGPGTSNTVITLLYKGDSVSVTGSSGDWYKVKAADGTIGWVKNDYIVRKAASSSRGGERSTTSKAAAVKSTSTGKTAVKNTAVAAVQKASSVSDQIVNYAKKFLGVEYVYGGNTPAQGFDCSGYVKYVFNHFGIQLERVAANQATQGTPVSKSNLRTGELVFFDTDGGHDYINHVGIYIGNGQFIQASSGRGQVTISSLDSGFYNNAYMTARRVF